MGILLACGLALIVLPSLALILFAFGKHSGALSYLLSFSVALSLLAGVCLVRQFARHRACAFAPP